MHPIVWSSLFLFLLACERNQSLFQLLPPDHTGIDFANTLTVNDSFNAIKYEYIYHGAGLAAGDFNNDGLTDLFFSGNQVSSRLYINRSGLRFEDLTIPAGLTTDRWCTGAAVADVNNDGRLDIYVTVAGFDLPPERMANLLRD